MKSQFNRYSMRIVVLLLCVVMVFMLCGAAAPVKPQDNYYESVNAEFISRDIPEGKMGIGPMYGDIAEQIEKSLIDDFEEMLKDGVDDDAEYMESVLHYYELMKDMEKRESDGVEPIKPYIERIEGIDDLAALQKLSAQLLMEGKPMPVTIGLNVDRVDSTRQIVEVSMPALMLGDVSFYAADNEAGQAVRQALNDGLQSMLEVYGYTKSNAADIVKGFNDFEDLLATYTQTAEEKQKEKEGDVETEAEALAEYAPNLEFEALMEEMSGSIPEKISLLDTAYFKDYDKVVNEENMGIIKDWMIVKTLYDGAAYLSTDIILPMRDFAVALTGVQVGDKPAEKTAEEKEEAARTTAYATVNDAYGPLIGYYYGVTHLDDETRDSVTEMVEDIMAEHRNRLENNDWLSDETIEKAIEKLDKMTFVVGYPDKVPTYVDIMDADPDDIDTAYECYVYTKEASGRQDFKDLNNPIDRTDMADISMNMHDVNAAYAPSLNGFYINAGILNEPIFDSKQSESANYGSIGMIIGHELSHAFDSNGAMYDENGNKNSWWTDEDLAEFEKRIDKMVNLFDGIPFADGKVNGQLTVTENTADAGGISVALAVLKTKDDYDLEEFFESFAKTWANKQTPQMESMALQSDVHSPAEVRVNMQCSNSDDFYDAYYVGKDDGMYLAPGDRVKIW